MYYLNFLGILLSQEEKALEQKSGKLFYEDNNIYASCIIYKPLMKLLSRVNSILRNNIEFKNNMLLQKIAILSNHILELPLFSTPNSKLLTGILTIIGKIQVIRHYNPKCDFLHTGLKHNGP